MGYVYEGARTFCEGFASKLCYTIFRNYILNHMTGGHDTCTFRKDRVDLRAALFCHGRNGDEGLSAF